jgi:hypothetical protein
MRKTSLLLGFGIGYVLGARAGRERYDQIVALWGRVSGSPPFQEAAGKVRGVASAGTKRGLTIVQQGVAKTGEAVRDRLNRADGGNGYSR